jgi:hypothetical protein
MNCLIAGNRIVTLERLRQVTGLRFSDNVYMYLRTAGRFAIKKYSGNTDSNGTSLTLSAYMERIKKGSGRYRKMIEKGRGDEVEVSNLRVVRTFFGIVNCEIPIDPDTELLSSFWNMSCLTIRLRTFAFQFFDNSVSVGARTAARYRNAAIDQRCVFCVKSGKPNPNREEFRHLFIDCPAIKPALVLVFRKTFGMDYNTGDETFRLFKLTGLGGNVPYRRKFFIVLNILFLNYVTWQSRLKKIVPSLTSLKQDIDTLFEGVMANKKLSEAAMTIDLNICRRWSSNFHGRG